MNIPNAISLFRLCLVPVFVLVYFKGGANGHIWAMAIFCVAGFSDVLDGYIARKYNMITKLGKLLDPLADKFMVFAALICAAATGRLHLIFPILYFVKEIWQAVGTLMLLKKASEVTAANFWGKGATFLFYLAVFVAIAIPKIPAIWVNVIAGVAFVMSVVAFVSYWLIGKKIVGKDPKK